MTQDFLNDELVIFPSTRHDDMLDCLANIKHPDIIGSLAFPRTQEYMDELRRQGRASNHYSNRRANSVLFR